MAKAKKDETEAIDNVDETEVIVDRIESAETSNDELNVYKAIARQHIKYEGKPIKAGEVFEIKESDLDELRQYAELEEGE